MTPHETCFEFQLVEVKEKTNRPHKRETKILLYFSVIYTKSELNMTLKVSFWYNGCACGMNFVIYKFVFYFLVLWFRRYFHVPAENQIETRQFYYDIVTCLLFIPREKKKRFMNNRTFYQVIFHTRISFCMYLETKTKNACSEIKQPLFGNGGVGRYMKIFFFFALAHISVYRNQ